MLEELLLYAGEELLLTELELLCPEEVTTLELPEPFPLRTAGLLLVVRVWFLTIRVPLFLTSLPVMI